MCGRFRHKSESDGSMTIRTPICPVTRPPNQARRIRALPWNIGGAPPVADLTNALAAYALRKLKSNATSAVRVRRSSDSTEQDIGFSGNNFDSSTLTAFCGAGSGFLPKWSDQTGNARDLAQTTTTSQPRIVNSGVYDGALVFDGTDDFLSLASVPVIKAFACWVNASSVAGASRIVSGMFGLSGNDFSLMNNGGTLEFYLGNVLVGSNTLSAGVNTHLCATWDGTVGKLYKNGTEVVSSTCTPISGTGAIALGSWITGTVQFFNGKMWDVRMYSVLKSPAEVSALYAEA